MIPSLCVSTLDLIVYAFKLTLNGLIMDARMKAPYRTFISQDGCYGDLVVITGAIKQSVAPAVDLGARDVWWGRQLLKFSARRHTLHVLLSTSDRLCLSVTILIPTLRAIFYPTVRFINSNLEPITATL